MKTTATELTIGADKSQGRPEIKLSYDKQEPETVADVLILCGVDVEQANAAAELIGETLGPVGAVDENGKSLDTPADRLLACFHYGNDLKVKAALRTKELQKFRPIETTIKRMAEDQVKLGFYANVEEAEADIRARLEARKEALAAGETTE